MSKNEYLVWSCIFSFCIGLNAIALFNKFDWYSVGGLIISVPMCILNFRKYGQK